MEKIKKAFSLIIVMIFLCQNTSFGIQERSFALRPPSHFGQTTEEFIRSQNEGGLRQETNHSSAPIEELVARSPSLLEGEYDFMPGEILQFKGKGGVLLTGDYKSGKSALAIKILDNDKRWECVSCGASDIKAVDLGGTKKILLGKRRSADNVIYSRLLGKREFLLSQEGTVIIKWIIALDDTAEDFLRQARDYGITVIKIDNSDMYSKFEELLQRINNTIYPEESIDIQDASVEILLTDEPKQAIPFKGLQTGL